MVNINQRFHILGHISMKINLQSLQVATCSKCLLSAFVMHTCFKSRMPLVSGCVDDALFDAVPKV